MEYVRVSDAPVPIWFAELAADPEVPEIVDAPILELIKQHGGLAFRGVSGSRLPTILRTGVDVEPADSVIYCDFTPDKAFEYGGPDKVMLVLRCCRSDKTPVLRRAVTQILPDTPPELVQEAEELYPYEIRRSDAGVTRCRVLPESPARLEYLSVYGHFIDGDPWDALVGILVYSQTREGHTSAMRSVLEIARRAELSS